MTRHEQAPRIVGDGESTDEIPIASPKVGEAERTADTVADALEVIT